MLGFAQILLLDDLSADQGENVKFIKSAGEHVLDLINDVLDISQIEAGALKLSLEPVHLNEVAVHALSMIRLQADQAHDTGTQLIAEGIETAREQATLTELGVHLGQGYHLGRPDHLPIEPAIAGLPRRSG